MENKNSGAKPFLKWAGGKTQLLPEIQKFYPQNIEKYCEPFVGGGAVLFDVITKFHPKEVLINDINPELTNTYTQIKTNVNSLLELLSDWQNEYQNSSPEKRKEIFYTKRERFNKLISGVPTASGGQAFRGSADAPFKETRQAAFPPTLRAPSILNADLLEKAALMIYLNKTCFNGLYRVNAKGLFNVPSGVYKNPLICQKENLIAVSEALQNVQIMTGSYTQTESFIDKNTFVYIDPPYRPLTKTAAFTSYSKEGFDDSKQIELGNFVTRIHKNGNGAKVLLSNSDPKNSNQDDNFFDDLYKDFNIQRVKANRMINSNSDGRGAITEIMVACL